MAIERAHNGPIDPKKDAERVALIAEGKKVRRPRSV